MARPASGLMGSPMAHLQRNGAGHCQGDAQGLGADILRLALTHEGIDTRVCDTELPCGRTTRAKRSYGSSNQRRICGGGAPSGLSIYR